MAVQTSRVTTSSNGTLQLNPNGSGKVRFNKLSGSNNQPVGVDNNGDTKKFKILELGAGTPTGTDFVMIQANGGSTVTKCTITDLVTAGGGTGSYSGINGVGYVTGDDQKFQLIINTLPSR